MKITLVQRAIRLKKLIKSKKKKNKLINTIYIPIHIEKNQDTLRYNIIHIKITVSTAHLQSNQQEIFKLLNNNIIILYAEENHTIVLKEKSFYRDLL